MDTIARDASLMDELRIAHDLIHRGFGELQEIDMGNDFYHLPQQLLASGLERLLKCYFCLVFEARNHQYPNLRFITRFRHDLQMLKREFAESYFHVTSQLTQEDLDFVKNDQVLDEIVRVLSEFGKKARYYNLDVVTGEESLPIDAKADWERIERGLLDPVPYMKVEGGGSRFREYYPEVNARIIARLERFVRAIAMQFTCGNHGGKLKQYSPLLGNFVSLRDSQFGTTDYRQSTLILKQQRDTWVRRSKVEVLASAWPTRQIFQTDFPGEWPFRHDEVVIECREKLFCIVNIEAYDFALNGAAKSRFGFPFPHDVDLAIIGKSVGPFIDMAHALGSPR
ncbi:MAG: hypothetical protein AMXMBFR82_38930 [Candidatus Hydrogenedentota bacterium]